MIWTREQYIAHSNFEFTGREMFCELFGPLVGLEEEWIAQSATKDQLSLQAFDWDYVLKTHLAVKTGAITGIKPTILESNDEYELSIDHMGRKSKLCKKSATIPLPIEYPVETMEDWLKIKHWYTFSEDRIDIEKLKEQKILRDKGFLTVIGVPGAFDEPRQLLGEENLCIFTYEQPELIHDILNTISDTFLKVIERIAEYVTIDCLGIHEDMAGKSGPLFGPIQVQELMKPYYNKVWSCVKAQGGEIFSQDSDGNMNGILNDLTECGLTSIYPCEPAAHMDIVQIREKFGKRFTLKGGLDKHALRADKETIRKELEYKICPLTKGGGTIFALDHRIPNGVSLENYNYYVNTARELLNLPPVSELGWERMAF